MGIKKARKEESFKELFDENYSRLFYAALFILNDEANAHDIVEEYLIDLNATQAAIRAGYKQSEYTDTNANKLLENTRIKEAVDKAMAERSKRTGINQDRVVEELAKLAFVNAADVIDVDTATILPDAKPEDLACIQSVKVKRTTKGKNTIEEREVKFYDKKERYILWN